MPQKIYSLFHNKLANVYFVCIIMLTGCTPHQSLHGQLPKNYQLEKLIIGEAVREDFLAVLGSPSTLASFNSDIWYYFGARTQRWAFFEEEILEIKIYAFSFNAEGVLSDIRLYDKDSLNEIDFSSNKTPTAGHSIGILEQLLGNFGRFNKE